MSLDSNKVKSSPSKRAPLLEPNLYPARINQVIDLGVQKRKPYQGTPKPPCNQIYITYELVDEFMPKEDGTPDLEKPRWVSEKLNLFSMDVENAKSTKRMLSIDPAGALGGDWTRTIDLPVLVQVVNREYLGKMYENVGAVSQPMKGQAIAELVNPPKTFDCDNPDKEVFESLPQFMQDMITSGEEWDGFDAAPAAFEPDEDAPY